MSKVYLADKDTLDSVNDKVGTSSDTASSAPTTLFAGIKHLINTLATHVTNWTATRAAKIDKLDNLGATGDTGGSATAGTLMAKLNALLTSWTSTRAGYLDNIRSYTITNNTASKTGVLSAKLAYIISLLENATYGLSAIKNAAGISGVTEVISAYTTNYSQAEEVIRFTTTALTLIHVAASTTSSYDCTVSIYIDGNYCTRTSTAVKGGFNILVSSGKTVSLNTMATSSGSKTTVYVTKTTIGQ